MEFQALLRALTEGNVRFVLVGGVAGHHLLWTRLGPLDLLGRLAGEKNYEELLDRAPLTNLGGGLRVHVLDLQVLIELKEALGRDKDRAQLPEYRRTLEERRKKDRETS